MRNGNNRPHRGCPSSRAESDAINHSIIAEFGPLFHHILAVPCLTFEQTIRRLGRDSRVDPTDPLQTTTREWLGYSLSAEANA